MRRRLLLCVSMASAIALAGCRPQPESVAAAAAPPLGDTAVGPLPGPPRDPPQAINPFATDAVATAEGRRLFVWFNCAGCHGDHGGGGMGPSLRDATWLYGSTDAKVANSIAEGRAHGMPAWGTMLTTEQIWKLAAYVKSLRSEREPEPPPGN